MRDRSSRCAPMRLCPVLLLALLAVAHDSRAGRPLSDYRYFRALSIDLLGRPPSRDELAAFERPGFDLDGWIAMQLGGTGYAERLRRIYMDLLRLEVGPSFQFAPSSVLLRRHEVQGPDGPIYVYFRRGQRRVDVATDGDFCLTEGDTGQRYPANAAPTGTARPVAQAVLDARTVVVEPWWLYADYRSAHPADRIATDWATRFPGFAVAPGLLFEPDGKTPTTAVRVCREEAQITDTGTVYASNRPAVKKGEPLPAGRLTPPPGDSWFARAERGRAVSCLSGTGFLNSLECGCGIGLERCLPGASFQNEPPAFVIATHTPLGGSAPFELTPQPA